ncbi:MAG: hypothetical protein MJZ60_07120 [Bacteroidaceae bacterium]|nr:hypothetical protein [Bacteroidaceae bacterium]
MAEAYITYYINCIKAFREKHHGKPNSWLLKQFLQMKDFHSDETIVYMIEKEIRQIELEIEIEELRYGNNSPQEQDNTKDEHKAEDDNTNEHEKEDVRFVEVKDSRGSIYKVEANKKHIILHNAIDYCIEYKITFDDIDANILRVLSRRTLIDTEYIRKIINKTKNNGLSNKERNYYIHWMNKNFKFNDLDKFPFLKLSTGKEYCKREKTA